MTLRPLVLPLVLLCACDPSAEKVQALEARVTALETKLEQAAADDTQAKAIETLGKRVEALEVNLDGVSKTQTATVTNLDDLAERVEALDTRTKALETASPATAETDLEAQAVTDEVEEIGIAECDDYIAMYRKCIDEKMPASVRETSKKALVMSADAWKKAAGTAAGRAGLAEACKAARKTVQEVCK